MVVVGCVATEHLEWIEREAAPAVVVESLAGGDNEQKRRLADRDNRERLRQQSKQETLERMIIEHAESVGKVKPVTNRMEVLVEKLVEVHRMMKEVLSRIEHKSSTTLMSKLKKGRMRRGEKIRGEREIQRAWQGATTQSG